MWSSCRANGQTCRVYKDPLAGFNAKLARAELHLANVEAVLS